MKHLNLIFPHQLFEDSPLITNDHTCYLVEEFLLFKQFKFHKQKIAFHRASMKFYEQHLLSSGKQVHYIDAQNEEADCRILIKQLMENGYTHVHCIHVVDDWLCQRIVSSCTKNNIEICWYDSPMFLNTQDEISNYFKPDKKKYFQTDFYKKERKKRHILVDSSQEPEGGKWTYDVDNRKKYPAKKQPPYIQFPDSNSYFEEAVVYVQKHFENNYGSLDQPQLYPTTFEETRHWLNQFFENRFAEFGAYEDAIVKEHSILNHSVLTPMLNVGLITPKEILENAIIYGKGNNIPLNSLEGFIRQIIGWREFIRGLYAVIGTKERTTNYWGFTRKIPSSFYNGTTGIPPVDDSIKKILQSGYTHHIERLMILGNFMLLCEFDPNEVYKWFMELFIDAYDWVMVPNVYGMSQFADGGLMATKPYISGSNYIMKMSNYKKGDWQQSWDGLFWRFMDVHRDFFLKNPRLSMLIRMYDKMPQEKKETHLINAKDYLKNLDALLN